MESKSTDVLIKQDLLATLLEDAQNPKGGDFTDLIAWSLGFSDSPSAILNYVKIPTSLANILNGTCQTESLKKEINEVLALLPYNISCNGLIIFTEILDKAQQDETAKLAYGQLQSHVSLKDQALVFTFIKKPEEGKKEFQSEDFYCVRIEGNAVSPVNISMDKQETALFELSKLYFSLLVPFSLPVNLHSTLEEVVGTRGGDELSNAVLNFKNTDLIFALNGEELDVSKDKLKETLKSLRQNSKKSKDEYTNFLSFIPAQEANLLFSKKPRSEIHPNGIVVEKNQKVLSNEFELLGYFRYDSDLHRELHSFGTYLSQKVSTVVHSQLNNPNAARSQNVLTFSNPFTGIGLTVTIPNGKDEENSEVKRRYHQRLHLPLDRPLLRRDDSLYIARKLVEADTSGKLRDVHYGLTTKGVPGGKKYLIHGNYIYYHYMQDSFDDSGWGCAYRSLQTLLSWFKVQRLVPDFKVPTIPEIQKILVEMGDKPKEFLGSKEWIGAFEVNLVLNKLLNVESRILFISSGAEIPSKARELKEHFINEGTPIMIGGGVLAYTLLGIDYNEETGDVKFLILDPHYTGSDNLKNIQDKGWIGWKEEKLFVQHAFYNFCLPQRKKLI